MPIIATIGRMAFGKACRSRIVRRPSPLARGANVILAQHVDHRRAHHAGVPAGAEQAERQRRQHQMPPGAVAADREPAEPHGKDIEQQQADDELRRRHADEGGDHQRLVGGLPRFTAAIRPMVSPMATSQAIAPTIRSRLAGRRDAISSLTSERCR
jgi:hypothetical protein